MSAPGKVAALALLVGIAGVCAFFAYRGLAPPRREAGPWSRAIALARRADRTRAVLPALQVRERAISLFDRLALSGPAAARSRARLLAGLLDVESAAAQPSSEPGLALAVGELQRAVRLDRSNDDAAYDLEILLARSVRSGHPIGEPRPEKKRSRGHAGASPVGTGY